MPTLTVLADTTDGISCFDTDYADIVNGVGTIGEGGTNFGQINTYQNYELLLSFDTGAVLSTSDVITSVTLELYGSTTTTDPFVAEARYLDWGGGTATNALWPLGDYTKSSILQFWPLLASMSVTNGGWDTSGYNTFTSESDFPDFINKTGLTNFIVCGDTYRTETLPTNQEVASANISTNPPRLLIGVLDNTSFFMGANF